MPAPIVTRPRAAVTVEAPASQAGKIDWAHYARYGLIAALVLGAAGLVAAWTLKVSDEGRETKIRNQWDEVFKGLKEKTRPEDRISALEALADNEKIKGSTAHASVLMQLADEHFEMSQQAKKAPDERAAARARAAALYKFIADNEPFKSNPSFGPLAARNLASVHEQSQLDLAGTEGLDKAIDALTEALYQGKGADAPPIAAMQSHYLFDPMRAQLGRLYWLRAQLKKSPENKADLDRAREYVNKALETPPSEEEKRALTRAMYSYRMGRGSAAWRDDAAYLKSLLDTPGKLVSGGIPAMREVKTDKKDDAEKKDDKGKTGVTPPVNGNATPAQTTPAPAKVEKVETKKDEPVKTEPKKDEPKKEEKKTGSLERRAPILASDDGPPAGQHMSYAQIQKLLKEGKSALCLCPRCADGSRALGAKLAE